jgi:hypothetical protein
MNTHGKWLVRARALLNMMAFIMTFMTVSRTAMPGFGQSFSLVDLTSLANQSSSSSMPPCDLRWILVYSRQGLR